jgi:hypothetical protein
MTYFPNAGKGQNSIEFLLLKGYISVIISGINPFQEGDGMVKKMIIIGFALSLPVFATPVTIVTEQDMWQYSVLNQDLYQKWNNVNYSTVDWNSLSWQTGQAAFAEEITSSPKRHTVWKANTDLALQKTVTIDGTLNGDLTLNLALDNGAIVFINGIQVFKDDAEGNTNYWEYTQSVSNSLFHQGDNVIQVLTEDHGSNTYFDMKLAGDISTSVPEPTTMSLALLGLLGIIGGAAARKRKS